MASILPVFGWSWQVGAIASNINEAVVLCVTLCKLSVPLPGGILEPLGLNEDTPTVLIFIIITPRTYRPLIN